MQQFNPASIGKTRHAQGYFQMKYPQKYVGKNPPVYRSSWEKDLMFTCDLNPSIIQWAAEPFAIPYYDPVTRTNRQYWPDFLITYMKTDGTLHRELVEIKPAKQCTLESAKGKKAKLTVATNQAKWAAASAFCKQYGLTFRVMTEQQLYKR